MYNINIDLPNNENIKGTKLVKRFKELYSNNINETINELKKEFTKKEEKDQEIKL